jgi:spore cortex biosynthesis protein YabQ
MNYLDLQLSSFLILFLAGIFLGIWFDFYRVWRGRIRPNPLLDFCGDLAFWMVALIGAGFLIYWGTWLELRLYVWLVIGIGVAFYMAVFSPVMIRLFLGFWKAAGWLPRLTTAGVWRLRDSLRRLRWRRSKMGGAKD